MVEETLRETILDNKERGLEATIERRVELAAWLWKRPNDLFEQSKTMVDKAEPSVRKVLKKDVPRNVYGDLRINVFERFFLADSNSWKQIFEE